MIRVDLPTDREVRALVTELTEAAGKPPSVLFVATRIGLSNITFRRNFPEVTTDLRRSRSDSTASAAEPGTQFDKAKRDNERLRRLNRTLEEQLELACCSIQRLTLENARLQRELAAAAKVTPIRRHT